jgi:hypothetical protein
VPHRSARTGIAALMTGLNTAYEEGVKRGFIKQQIVALSLTFGALLFAGVIVVALAGHCHENAGAQGWGSIMMANDNHLVRSSPISPRDHPARSVVVCPVHAQLSRR